MGLALDEPGEGRALTSVGDVDMLVDEDAKGWVEGTQVDYITSPYGNRFIIRDSRGAC